ncbi:hypothetical protein [Lederbergia lenta]|nr:hypothetical protein [Lederbergia lenta]MCM3109681.1 hypothetical protein [Lederbergia lenta]
MIDMTSVMCSIECPNCGRSAIEDNYYKSEEKYIYCYRCGYLYKRMTKDGVNFQVDKNKGYGHLSKKSGEGKAVFFNSQMTIDQLGEYTNEFYSENTSQEKSYLITYEDGVFRCLLGTPTDNFHLSFEEFKEKMIKKYGEDEFGLVPIEV